MDNAVWRPRNWSIYRQSIRTNNDVEGREERGGDTEKRQYTITIMYATENESLMMQKKNHIEIME